MAALAVAMGQAVAVAQPVLAATPPLVQQQPAGQLEAADESSAMALAYRSRKPVLVTGLTSATSMVWAQPDGTFRAEMHSSPVRVASATGWVDVDLTLERKADGSVAPKAHPYGLWLSGARSAESDALVRVGPGAQRTRLGWRGALPEPQLDGPKAVYSGVKPDVDLVVEARPTGFQYSFMVKTPQAAAGMATVGMPWSQGEETAPASRLTGSEPPVAVSQGEMWDSRLSESGEPLHHAPVDVSTEVVSGRTELVLRPDQEFYEDPGLTFPVTIDPSINFSPSFDTYVQNTISSTDKSGDDELRLGYSDDADEGCGSGCLARSFLSFRNLGGYSGATVLSAELFLWNFYSWQCAAASWETWRVGPVGSSVRWGSQPSWIKHNGTSSGTAGYNSNCGDDWVSASVKDVFQTAFTGDDDVAYVGLRASSETNHSGWKKFHSSEASKKPYVQVIYNRTPNVPTGLAVDSCYSSCASPAVVRSGKPELSATVSDPDRGTLRAEYEVFDQTGTTVKARSGTALTGVVSGTAKPWRVVPLSGTTLPDGSYVWRARACDSYTCGGWSGWFYFDVVTSDPAAPTVTGTPYAEASTGTWNGGPGQAGTFTFGQPLVGGVEEYVYSLNDGPSVTVPAGVPQGEQLTLNQRQVSTDLTGFSGHNATIARDTTRGHDSGESLTVTPLSSGGTPTASQGDTFASLGGDYGGMRLGMYAGQRYSITGWIYVPAGTGLNTTGTYGTSRGLRIVAFYKTGTTTVEVASAKATVTDGWQRLSLTVKVPADATEAFVRLYNGFSTGQTGKPVHWDDLSVRRLLFTYSTETITPIRDHLNELSVQARNEAGATSDPRIYQFLVNPSDGSWVWTFDQDTAGTAASVPDGFPATHSPTGVAPLTSGRFGGGVTLDGTGDLTTSAPVLNTTHTAGFTVAAWVRLTDLTTSRTAVAQMGAATAMFRLGYRNDVDVDGDSVADPAWCFSVTRSDSATAEAVNACTTEWVAEGEWVSLVGVYDKPAGVIRLGVNGTSSTFGTDVTVPYTGDWSATGALTMGRGFGNADRWVGDLDEVTAVQRAWPDIEINAYAYREQ
ncbi:DNRLRE domain-containing protein [Micromonospora echinaurantiaca]|uniref:DNRLRE domain-containing protein n=1 Tax=Micromonospora echinaurantiaca TaxID=47857 RepID=UPI0037A2DAE7